MADLDELKGTSWAGKAELWADPLGDAVSNSDCTIKVEDGDGTHGVIAYTWSRDGKAHEGRIALTDEGAFFRDSFHAESGMNLEHRSNERALFCLEGKYQQTWGWRIFASLRTPTGELVLQMTNIAPWGEEARAVRMVAKKV